MSVRTEKDNQALLENQVRLIDRKKFYDWTDTDNLQHLIEYQTYAPQERVSNHDLGIHIVTATFGDTLIGSDQLQTAIDNHISDMKIRFDKPPAGNSLAGKTGFEVSHWGREIPYEQSLPLQVALGTAVALDTLNQAGISPQDIDRLCVASSFPFSLMLGKYIGEQLGLRPDAEVRLYAAACYSQAMAFNEEVDQATSDRTTLILGIETFMGMRVPTSHTPGFTDQTALSMFTDKLTGMIFNPHRFRSIHSTDHQSRDVEAALSGTIVIPLSGQKDTPDSLIITNPLATVIEFPNPPEDQMVFMKPIPTTRFFLRFLKDMIGEKFLTQGGQELLPTVDYAISHHPSILIHQKIREIYEKAGLKSDLLPWSSHYGNAPVCIYAQEMARIVPYLKSGHRILSTFFGAGATGGVRVLEIV